MEDQIITISFTIAAILVVLYLIFAQRFFETAKKFDLQYFEKLGSPHIIMNNRPKHGIILTKEIFTRNYKKSNSPEVVKAGNTVYILFWLILLSYAWVIYVI